MSNRTIYISRYKLPGADPADDQEVSLNISLVDSAGIKIDGYREDDGTGIIGTLELTLGDEPIAIHLAPTSEIFPESYWNVQVFYDYRRVRNANVQMDAGGPLTLAEFLALELSP